MEEEFRTKGEEREHLSRIIKEWNASRLDMFALTEPNEDLEFHGVMRFYFQEAGKTATKCVRVSSRSSVGDLLDTLIEKFNPDMKMLSKPNFELYETHANGEARKLEKHERPLLVQLGWHKDDREGRFLLISADAKFLATKFFESHKDEGQLKRRLSRREKKEMKKKRKEEVARGGSLKPTDDTAIAEQLYNELPETSLTRSISNPEAVMKRRRQQKLERRLKEFESKDGRHTGGMIKIFAESLKPEIPYKTILASNRDTTERIVKEALEKFMLEKEDPDDYCLVMAVIPVGESTGGKNMGKERVVRDDDCPLGIQSSWPPSRGYLTFHLRKRYSIPGLKKDRKTSQSKLDTSNNLKEPEKSPAPKKVDESLLPFFLELNANGKDSLSKPKKFLIYPNVTMVGTGSRSSLGEQSLQLSSLTVLPQHCVIANMEGAVTITPSSSDAFVAVNGQRILETTMLQDGFNVRFDANLIFRFCDRAKEPNKPEKGFGEKPVKENDSLSLRSGESGSHSRENSKLAGGPAPYSPPLTPRMKEKILNEQTGSKVDEHDDIVVETTFGVDGEIESSPVRKGARSPTVKAFAKSSVDVRQIENEAEHRMVKQFQQSTPDLASVQSHDYINPPKDEIDTLLPAMLEFLDHGQDAFFASVVSEVNGAAVHFKLAPTYTLYLACRFMISPEFRPELGEVEHAQAVNEITKKVARIVHSTIQDNDCNAGGLAFWLANASELLHFLKQDFELTIMTQTAQNILAQAIQQGFRLLVHAMEDELELAMAAFLDPEETVDIHPRDLEEILNDDLLERAESMDLLNWNTDERTFRVRDSLAADGRPLSGDEWISPAARIRSHGNPIMADVLYILSSAMSLLRRCRVNAALTIQLFSQLFHFVNMWLFNKLVLDPELGLCTRTWGHLLRRRIGYVEAWAERQGLELAADCHLCRVIQAAHLLEAPKSSAEDIASISSACFKLNSLQLTALLREYRPEWGEPEIPFEVIDSVVAVAENTADELARKDGRDIQLEEEEELQLPFLLPEDGYSCDIIRGVPPGLQEFLEPLIHTGLCNLIIQPASPGLWTVYQESYRDGYGKAHMSPVLDQYFEDPELATIVINKGGGGLGLSIVSAKGPVSEHLGIYIKAVVKGGAAEADGRLQAGDQLLSVNGNSLVGVSQERAAEYMMKTGPVVTLEVARQAAVYHGLAALLNQQPPKVSSGPPVKEIEEPARVEETAESLSQASAFTESAPTMKSERWMEATESEDEVRRKKELQRQIEYEQRLAAEEKRREEMARRRAEEEEEQRRMDEEIMMEERRRAEERRLKEEEAKYEEERRLAEQRAREEEEARRIAELERQEEERRVQEERLADERRRQEEKRYEELLRREEQRRLEEQRLQEERAREEQRRLQEEQRLVEEQRRQEHLKHLEEQRQLEEQRRLEEQRQQEEQRRLAEQRRQEEQRRLEERRRAEEERRREEQKRLEEQRRVEEMKKLEEQKRLEEQRRLEEQKKLEEKRRLEEQHRMEEKRRREEEARIEEERRQQERARLEERRAKEEEERRLAQERKLAETKKKAVVLQPGFHSRKLVVQQQTVPVHASRSQPLETDLDAINRALEVPDVDELPPPPDDFLEPGDDDAGEKVEDRLQERIKTQLEMEQRERAELERDQQLLRADDAAYYNRRGDEFYDDTKANAHASRFNVPVNAGYDQDSDLDVEQEFQRRVEAEKRKRDLEEAERSRYVNDEIEHRRRQVEHEYRIEHERKLQVLLGDRGLRPTTSGREKSTDNAMNEQSGRLGTDQTQSRSENELNQSSSQGTKPEQDDWLAQQRMKRERMRKEQDRIRAEQKAREEEDRMKLKEEVQRKRERDEMMMQEYNKQKDEAERRRSQSEMNNIEDSKPSYTVNIGVVQTQQSQARRESGRKPGPVRGSVDEGAVREEFKTKAVADYERRRETLDAEIENFEKEFNLMMRSTSPIPPSTPPLTSTARNPPPPISAKPTRVLPPVRGPVKDETDDEPPPPRPPPPRAIEALSPVVRSPLPYSPGGYNNAESTRFDYQGKALNSNFSYDSNRHERTDSGSRLPVDATSDRSSLSPNSGGYGRVTSNSYRDPVRSSGAPPENLSFKERMKMFGQDKPHFTDKGKFSRVQRDYMD